MKHLLFLLCLVLYLPFLAHAGGPWPQAEGNGYFKLSQWWIVFDQHYTDSGKLDPNLTTGVFNTAFYGEYGFTDRLTGIIYAPLFSRNYMNNLRSQTTGEIIIEGEALNSIGDIDLGAKYGITPAGSQLPISVTLLLGIPSGTTGAGSLGNLQTGDGEFNQILQFDAGKSFQWSKNTPGYVSAYTGVNIRSNNFSEEFRYGFEVGVNILSEKLWLIGRLNAVESFKNGKDSGTVNSTSIFANNSEFTSYGFEAAYYISPKLGVSASVSSAFKGEIIAAAPAYSVGVFYDLKK